MEVGELQTEESDGKAILNYSNFKHWRTEALKNWFTVSAARLWLIDILDKKYESFIIV